MTRDPLAGLSTPVRLWLGSTLCVLALGLVWSVVPGGPESGIFQGCTFIPGIGGHESVLGPGLDTGDLSCTVLVTAIAETPGHIVVGAQVPVRIFLVFAAVVLAYAATRRRTHFTKQVARAATVAMAIVATVALADRTVLALVLQLAGLALVAPLVWRRQAVLDPARD